MRLRSCVLLEHHDFVFQHSLCFSPLEQFVRAFVEAVDGAWDEIEPQVYDLLTETELLQVTFEPEALPDLPRAQLAASAHHSSTVCWARQENDGALRSCIGSASTCTSRIFMRA